MAKTDTNPGFKPVVLETFSGREVRFWPVILESFSGKKLREKEADRVEKRVLEVTGWDYPMEEKTDFVESACQN